MREFYLIPKSIAERYIPNQDDCEPQIKEKPHHPQKKKKESRKRKQKPVKKIKMEQQQEVDLLKNVESLPTRTLNNGAIQTKPNLDRQIELRVKSSARSREYVKNMLSLLKNTPNIEWDENGNLLQPIHGYNIIDILAHISDKSNSRGFSRHDLPFVKILFHSANLSPAFIRSSKIKDQLFGAGRLGRGKTKKKAKPRTNSKAAHAQLMCWECY